ncbi:hypothetical protein [Sphaerisporangium dianthi]|uniref:DUF4932 domain-containing protein n=1 Tax=Sphaerisporangium dianthi TaxID=1436120 RepID=A0ABV9CN75_9ACTN
MTTQKIPTMEDALAVVQRDQPVDRTLDLPPLQVNAKHGDVLGLSDQEVTVRLASIYRIAGHDPALAQRLTDTQLRLWLLYAVNLLAVNREAVPGFDFKGALTWLVNNMPAEPVMPAPNRREFELQVLGRTRWLRTALKAKVARLPDQVRQQAAACYGPPPSNPNVPSGPGASSEQTPPLDKDLLRKELLPKLQNLLLNHVVQWSRPSGREPRFQQWEDLGLIARLAQTVAWQTLQPYAAAREDGPFFTGFDYFSKIYDKTRTLPTEQDLVKHLMNRAYVAGEDTSAGKSVFTLAGYDSMRSDDRVFLFKTLGQWIAEQPSVRRLAIYFFQHIGSSTHAGTDGGGVGLVTEFRTDRPESQARWETIETIVHEMAHNLIHPNLLAQVDKVRRPMVIKEGFIEVVTREVFNWMIDNGSEASTKRLMMGVEGQLVPPVRKTTLGYAESGVYADQIFQLVGRERFLTAFFTGDIELVGLSPS